MFVCVWLTHIGGWVGGALVTHKDRHFYMCVYICTICITGASHVRIKIRLVIQVQVANPKIHPSAAASEHPSPCLPRHPSVLVLGSLVLGLGSGKECASSQPGLMSRR